MKKLHDISFIVVNYNGYSDTYELLDSIEKNLTKVDYQVVVVDNGSAINECEKLKSCFHRFTYVRSERNLGFAGGNNLGISASNARYLMLINNDTVLPDGSVAGLIGFMDSNPGIGAASPKILFYSEQDIIQYAGYTDLSNISLRNKGIGFREKDQGQYDKPSSTCFTHGAAMIVRKEVIETAGFMPEMYFLYYEEIDWCYRIREAGYSIWYYPHTIVLHKESSSVGSDSPLKMYYMTRNRYLLAMRNRRGLLKILSYLYLTFFVFPKNLIKSFINGRLDLAKAICKGSVAFIKMSLS